MAAARSGRRLSADRAASNGEESNRATSGGVYFAAADEIVTFAEFGRRIGRALGIARTTVIPNVGPAVWTVALGSELVARVRRRPLIFGFDKAREALAGSWACSSEALARDTSWRPERSLDERLEQTVAWYREQGWLPKPGLLLRLARHWSRKPVASATADRDGGNGRNDSGRVPPSSVCVDAGRSIGATASDDIDLC
jgi:hypothetical protein